MKISVLIVNHKADEYVRRSLALLPAACGKYEFETVVMDNSPEPEPIAGADVWEPIENRGFGNGCNLAAQRASGELLLFLNPDSECAPGSIEAAADCLLREEKAGLVGVKILLPDGKFEGGALRGFPTPARSLCYFLGLEKLFPRNHTCGGYHMSWLDRSESHEVDSVSGSFMLMPRSLFEELGGFDESFFMYGEDMDLCMRVHKAGRRVLYCADGTVLHHHGKSGKSERQTAAFYDSMTIFYDKHYRADHSALTTAAVHLGVKLMRARGLRKLRKEVER